MTWLIRTIHLDSLDCTARRSCDGKTVRLSCGTMPSPGTQRIAGAASPADQKWGGLRRLRSERTTGVFAHLQVKCAPRGRVGQRHDAVPSGDACTETAADAEDVLCRFQIVQQAIEAGPELDRLHPLRTELRIDQLTNTQLASWDEVVAVDRPIRMVVRNAGRFTLACDAEVNQLGARCTLMHELAGNDRPAAWFDRRAVVDGDDRGFTGSTHLVQVEMDRAPRLGLLSARAMGWGQSYPRTVWDRASRCPTCHEIRRSR